MESYLDNFVKIHSKEIRLHKEIDDSNILVLIGEFRRIYIIDRNDLGNDVTSRNFYFKLSSIPKTTIVDQVVAVSNWTANYIVYPYLDYKTQDEMQSETLDEIRKRNKFIEYNNNDESILRASIIIILNKKCGDEFSLDYWCNSKILENIYAGKREIRSSTVKYLAGLEKTNEIIKNCHANLDKIMECCSWSQMVAVNEVNQTSNETAISNYKFDDSILKENIKLFNYQKHDIIWMKGIENRIKSNENTIEYKSALSCSIINDQFVLLNDKIFPKWMVNTDNHNIIKRFRFHGGSLISELGLGKTLTILYYITNESTNQTTNESANESANESTNKSEYTKQHTDYFIEYKTTCNYFYKRGRLTGQSCEKKTLDGSLYCREHKSTPFCDKRAIIYKNLQQFDINNWINKDEWYIRTCSNLIICPNHLCDQWVREFYEKFAYETTRILMIVTKDQWNNVTLGDIIFSDIVVVSYNLLISSWYTDLSKISNDKVLTNFLKEIENVDDNSEILNLKGFTLNIFKWNRIILDEIHEINERSNLFLDIKNLISDFVWNVTGTPFANGLFGYLNLMSLTTNLNTEILDKRSFNTSDLIELGLDTNLVESSQFLFRRNTRESVKSELQGTIIEQFINLLEFTENERNIYNSYSQEDRTRYINFLIKLCCDCQLSNNKLISSSHTFEEISQLLLGENEKQTRELSIKIDDLENDIKVFVNQLQTYEEQIIGVEIDTNEWFRLDYEIDNLKNSITTFKRNLSRTKQNFESHQRISNYLRSSIDKIEEQESCTICLEDIPVNEIGITKCGHKYCWKCIKQLFEINGRNESIKCPNCNELLKTDEVFLLKQNNKSEKNITSELDKIVRDVRSTKIGNIIHFLRDKIDEKFIIFSQWDEILQKVGNQLKKYNFNPVYCNGSVYNRKRSIETFQKDPKTNIIMLSSKYAASGINLTQAHNIILIEPIYGKQEWRTNIENQAIGRANRIGQQSKINVWRFIIKDTIEEEILNNTISNSDLEKINTI